MDLRLANDSNGLDAAQQLYEKFGVRCLFVSANIDDEVRSTAARFQALGFLGKPFLAAEVISAVQAAARATGADGP
jgi:DNA-binding NarL/FixJ family response regulator